MKKTSLALTALLIVSKSCYGFMELEEGALILETEFFGQYDSNIRGTVDDESDFIFSVDPTLQYQRSGRANINASLGMNFVRFDEFDTYDSEDLHGDFNFGFPVTAGSPLSGNFNLSYKEDTAVDQFVNDRIATETTSASLSSQYRLRQRLQARGNISYMDQKSERFSDIEDKSASVGIIFDDLWQDVGLTVDYRARDLKSSGEVGSQRNGSDSAILIGLTGQILPKNMFNNLEAFASVSFQKVDSTITGGEGSRDIIGYDGSIAWSPRETTAVTLAFNKDVQNTVADETVENSNISLGIRQDLSRTMSGSINVYTQDISYFGVNRSDERIGVSTSLTAILGRNWSAGARISYDDSSSTDRVFRYSRTTVGVFSVYRF